MDLVAPRIPPGGRIAREIPGIRLALVAGAAAAALYAGSLKHEFTFDDRYIIAANPIATGEEPLARAFATHYWAGADARGNLYRPLTVASYRLNHLVSGPDPWSYHLVNLTLHGLVCALLVILLGRLTGSPAASAAGSILFAVHPVHVEAVASAVGRAELLAALFLLGAWIARERLAVVCILFACALLSKENAVVLPALLLVEDVIWRRVRPDWRRYLPLLGVIALWWAARMAALGPASSTDEGPFAGSGATVRLLTAVDVIGRCLRLMFWPAHLSADYSYAQIPLVDGPLSPGFAAGAATIAACAAAAALAWRWQRSVAGGLLVFFVALAPVANVFFGIGVMMAERLLYVPSAGLCLAAGALVAGPCERAWPRRAVAVACLLVAAPAALLGARTVWRVADWRDQLTLFESTVRESPRSALAHYGLGSAYLERGRSAEAEAEFRRALAINPALVDAHYDLGVVLQRGGRGEEAAAEYREAIRLDSGRWKAHQNLGMLYEDAGRMAEAEAEYREAIASSGTSADPRYRLALLLETAGRLEEAIAAYRDASRLRPDDAQLLNNLGRALLRARRPAEAIEVLDRAVALKPDAPVPLVNLAAAWLEAGDPERATEIVRRVLASHPDDGPARRVLAAAQERSASGGHR